MIVDFTKMNGAGNDFIVIDNRKLDVKLEKKAISFLCDRKRGVGADGVILLEASGQYDFHMLYYNSDGGEAEMCGNGARCIALYANSLGLGKKSGSKRIVVFSTKSGSIEATVSGDRISVSMGKATALSLNISLRLSRGEATAHFINTGVPHVVMRVEDAFALTDEYVLGQGSEIRKHEHFKPIGTNVDFVSLRSDGGVAIRTFERGVEEETLACGTGSIAAAVILAHLRMAKSPVQVSTKGGDVLRVSFNIESFGASKVILDGPAAVNFTGSVAI
jgi:diaminopimelate epimerase